jgi:hypothetical protein
MKNYTRKLVFIPFLLCVISLGYPVRAQVHIFSGTRTSLDPQGRAIGYYTVINEVPYTVGLKGSEYLYEEWRSADIILTHDSTKYHGIPVRLNVRKNVVEVNLDGEVKLLSLPSVYSLYFPLNDALFITSSVLDEDLPYGFYEVIYNKTSALLCRYITRIRPSNYTIHFDMGERDNRLMILGEYYAIMDGMVIHLQGRCKKLSQQFQSQEDLAGYIMEHRITASNEEDLIDLLAFFDSIRP